MSRTRFQRVAAIFEEALERDAPEREAFVAGACGGDEDLRAEVEAMLARHRPEEPGWMEAAQRSLLEDAAPAAIGRFRVLRVIASGAMGTVYEAEQDDPHRTVALKVLRRGATSPSMLRRFRHEAEFLGQLHHPHIAQVYEASTHDDGDGAQPWFAMEFVQGRTLTEHARVEDLDVRARIALLLKVCDAVQHAHDRGIIHRDLKPENILVDERGEPRILDFGIARATDADLRVTTMETGAGVLVGTIPYMSPEQVSGVGEPDARSDVYALGVILYELLAGRLPHDLRGKTIPEAARIIQEDEPSSLGTVGRAFRGDLETIVAKALEKDPDRRYASAADLAADLRHFLRDEPIVARPASTLYQLRKFARRNPALVGGVVVSFALLVAGIIGVTHQLHVTEDEVARFTELYEFSMGNLSLLNPARSVDVMQPPTPGGELPAAEVLLLDAVARLDAAFERWPETRADVGLELAIALWGIGCLDEALELIDEAVRLRTEHSGPDDLETYRARLWGVQLRLRSSQPPREIEPEALAVADALEQLPDAPLRDVVAARLVAADALRLSGEQVRPAAWTHAAYELAASGIPDDPIVFDAGRQLAEHLAALDRHDEALGILGPLVERARQEVDERDVSRRRLETWLASLFLAVGLPDEALAPAREAVALGRLQPVPAFTTYEMKALVILAAALRQVGRGDEAVELLRERVDACREHLGPHLYTQAMVARLARFLDLAGQEPEAEARVRAALEETERTPRLREDSRIVMLLHAALAEALGLQGCVDDAAEAWRTAIALADQLGQFGVVVGYRRSLAELLAGAGRPDEALAAWRERLEKAERDFPRARRFIAYARRHVAYMLRKQAAPTTEELEEAAVLALAAVRDLEAIEGTWHHWTVQARCMHAKILSQLERPEEAAARFEEALADTSCESDADDFHRAWMRASYGRCLTELGRYEEAESELLAAEAGLVDPLDPDLHLAYRTNARNGLADLYEAWGRPQAEATTGN